MKKLFPSLTLACCLLCSCKKDNPSTPAELIVGRWTVTSATHELFTNGTVSSSSEEHYGAGAYAEFKSNGSFQSQTSGAQYNQQYQLKGDTLIFDNTNTARIKILTANNLTYFFRDSINPAQYRVNTFYLVK